MNDPALLSSLPAAGPPELLEGKRWDVFIAHAGGDDVPARILYRALREGGCRPFLDAECLELGCDWDAEIASAQRQSLFTVVLISTKTPEAHFQREEIQTAIALARQKKTRHRVIPIWLDGLLSEDDASVPYGLRTKHGIAITRKTTLQDAAALIVRSVRGAGTWRPPLPIVRIPSFITSLPRSAWLASAALALALPVRFAGQLAHDARASILGLPPQRITYAEVELWGTGAKVILGLVRSALFDLLAGVGIERWGAPVAAALAVGWFHLARSRFQRTSMALLPAAVAALIAGVLFYAIAVNIQHVVIREEGSEWACGSTGTVTQSVTFEVCSWLMNGTDINAGRSGALMGLWGWLFAAVCTAGGCSAREWWRGHLKDQRGASLFVHGILGAVCVLAGVFLLRQAPRAYALHTWGLKYPRVSIKEPGPPELREGVASGQCRVWDVSADAREVVLLRWGSNCRDGIFAPDAWAHHVFSREDKELEGFILDGQEEHIFGSR